MRLTQLVHAIDHHAAGEPGRVIVGGVLDFPGKTMFEKMKYFERNLDDLRLRMLREPRGYPAANSSSESVFIGAQEKVMGNPDRIPGTRQYHPGYRSSSNKQIQ